MFCAAGTVYAIGNVCESPSLDGRNSRREHSATCVRDRCAMVLPPLLPFMQCQAGLATPLDGGCDEVRRRRLEIKISKDLVKIINNINYRCQLKHTDNIYSSIATEV